MDNNFNQQQVPQQQVPQQPTYQQQQMPQQPVYQQAPKKPSNINVMELIALICSGVGLLMAVLGTLFYCSCSASASFETGAADYTNSVVMIVAIFGVLIAIAGVVMAILAINKKDAAVKAGKLSYVAAAVGIFAVLYGTIPTITICGYNCSLNSAMEDMNEESATLDYSDMFDF